MGENELDGQPLQKILGNGEGLMKEQQEKAKKLSDTEGHLNQLRTHVTEEQARKLLHEGHRDFLRQMLQGGPSSVTYAALNNVAWQRARYDRLLAMNYVHTFAGPNTPQNPTNNTLVEMFRSRFGRSGQTIPLEQVQSFVRLTDHRLQLYTTEVPLLSRYASVLGEVQQLSEKKINGKSLLEHLQSPQLLESLRKRKEEGGARGAYANRRLVAAEALAKNIPDRLKRVTESRDVALGTLERLQRIQTLTQLLAIRRGSTGAEGLQGSLNQIYGDDPALQGVRQNVQGQIEGWITQLQQEVAKTEGNDLVGGANMEERLAQRGDDLIGQLRTAAQDAVMDTVNGRPHAVQSVDALVSDYYQAQTIIAYEFMQNNPDEWNTWWPLFRDGLRDEMQRQTARDAFNAAMFSATVMQGMAAPGMLPAGPTDKILVEQEMKRQGGISPILEQQLAQRWQVYRGAMADYAAALRGIVNANGGNPNPANPQNWVEQLWNDRGSGLVQEAIVNPWNPMTFVPRALRGASWNIARVQFAFIRAPLEGITGQPWLRTRIEGVLKEMEDVGKELSVTDEATRRYYQRHGAYGVMIEQNAKLMGDLAAVAPADTLTMNGRPPRMPQFVPAANDNDPCRDLAQAYSKQYEAYQKALKTYAEMTDKGGEGKPLADAREVLLSAHRTLWEPYLTGLRQRYQQEAARPLNVTQSLAKLRPQLTTAAQRTAFDRVADLLQKTLKEQQEFAGKAGQEVSNEQVFTRVFALLNGSECDALPPNVRQEMDSILRAPMNNLWKIQQRVAGAYLALTQQMQHDLIPRFSQGNQELMRELGLVAGRNVAEQHIMADAQTAFWMAAGGAGLALYGRAGSGFQGGGMLGRLANRNGVSRFLMGGTLDLPLGRLIGRTPMIGRPYRIVRGLVSSANAVLNPFAVTNGVVRLAMLDPVTDTVRFLRGSNSPVSQIMRIARNGSLTLEQQTAQIVGILNQPTLTIAQRQQILEELIRRGVNVNGSARQSLAINAVLRGGSAMSDVERGRIALALLRANGGTQLTEEALRGMVSTVHLFQQQQLEAAYKTLAEAHTALSRARNATTIANVQNAERAVVDILRAKANRLVQLGMPAEQANLLVRSAVCGSEGAAIAQNVARMPGITISQEMRAVLGAHVSPASGLSMLAPRAGAGMRLVKGAPFLLLDAYLTYQSYVELGQAREERDKTIKEVTAVLLAMGFRRNGDFFELQAQGSRGGIRLRMTDLLTARDAHVDTRTLNAGVQTGGLLVGAAAMAYGGPVGMIVGLGAAAIVVSVNVYGDVKDFEKAYALLANRDGCPSWLFWLLGGARSLTGRSGMELLEGPGFLASFFASEAPPAAKERMLFCAVIEKLSPEERMELMEAASMGRTDQIASLDSLYEAFPVAKDFFSAQLFARYPDPISWDDARNLKIPSRPWIFDGPHASALFGSIRSTSHMFAAHVLEQNYLRVRSLVAERPDDPVLAQQLRMLGRHRVFGSALGDSQEQLVRNQPQGVGTRTRASMISEQVRQQIEKLTGGGGTRSVFVNQESLAAARKAYSQSLAKAQANGDKEFPREPSDREHLRPMALAGINGLSLLQSQNFDITTDHTDLWSGDLVLSLPPQNNNYALAEWAIAGQMNATGEQVTLPANATSDEAERIFREVSQKTALDSVSATPHVLMGYLPPRDVFSPRVPVLANNQALPFSFLREDAVANLASTPHMGRPASLHFTSVGRYAGGGEVIVQTLGYTDFGNVRKARRRVLLVGKNAEGRDVVTRAFAWNDVPPADTHPGLAAMRTEADEALQSATTRHRDAGRNLLRSEGAHEAANGELTLRGKVFRYVPDAQRWEWRDSSGTTFAPVTAAGGAQTDVNASELNVIAATLESLNGGSIVAAERLAHVRSFGEELLRMNGAMQLTEDGLKSFVLQQPPDPYRMQFRWRQGKWEVRTNANPWEQLSGPQNFYAMDHASSFGRWLRLRNALARANTGDVSGMSEVQDQLVDEHEEAVGEYLRTALGASEQTVDGEKRFRIQVSHPSGDRALTLRCDDGEWQVQDGGEWIPTEDFPQFTLAGVLPQHRQRIERLNASFPALNNASILPIVTMTDAARRSDRETDRALTQKIAGEYFVQSQQKEAGGFMNNAQMLYAVAEGTFNTGATNCLIRLRPDRPGEVAPLAYCLPDGRVLLLRRNNAGGLDRRILPNLQGLGIVTPGAAPMRAEETTKIMEQRGKQMLDVLAKTEAQNGWVSLDTPIAGGAEAQKQFQEQIMTILALPVRDIGHDLETNVIANVEHVFHRLQAQGLLDPALSLTPNIGDPNAGELPISQPVDMVVRAFAQYAARNPGATIDAFVGEVNAHIEAERQREENKTVNLSVVSRAAHNVELGRPPRVPGQ